WLPPAQGVLKRSLCAGTSFPVQSLHELGHQLAVLPALIFLLLHVLHDLGLLLRLVQGQDLDPPLPPGEVLVQNPLVDVQPPQPAVPAASAGAEPKLVEAGARLVRGTPVYQEPLPGELLNPREGQVFKLQRLEGRQKALPGVVDQDRRAAPVQAGAGDRQQERPHVEQVGGGLALVSLARQQAQVQRYGFAYGTLPEHAESGEERFSVGWDDADD